MATLPLILHHQNYAHTHVNLFPAGVSDLGVKTQHREALLRQGAEEHPKARPRNLWAQVAHGLFKEAGMGLE